MLNKKAMAAFAAGATLLSSFAFAAPAMALTIGDLAAADFKAPSESTLNGLDKYISIRPSSNGALPKIQAFEVDSDAAAEPAAETASDLLGEGSASEGDADVSVDLSGADDFGFDDVDFDLSDVEAPAAETPAPAAKAALKAAPAVKNAENADLADADLSL